MTIVITIIASVVLFFVGFTFGAVNNTEPLPRCCANCLHTHNHHNLYPPFENCCDHFGLATTRAERDALRIEVRRLDFENHKLQMQLSDYRNMPHDAVWFKAIGDKEKVVEKLKEMSKPLEELKKELKF